MLKKILVLFTILYMIKYKLEKEMNFMKKNKKIILILLGIFCVLYIFFNSSQNFNTSNLRSYNIINKFNIGNVERQYIANKILRKIAHIMEYMGLTLVILIILKSFKLNKEYIILTSLLLCVLIGLEDEYYQSFIPGRSSKVLDVFVDFLGGILAIIFYNIGKYIIKKIKR